MVGTRKDGPAVVRDLFGLDDRKTAPPAPLLGHRATLDKKIAKSRKSRVSALNDDASLVSDTAPLVGVQIPSSQIPVSSETSHNAVATVKPLKLSKAQWLQVAQVKMTGHWSNQEEVESFKVVHPSVSDPYYFWMYWDTPAGRDGLDRCGWQVADLNKHLLSGKLTFKQVGKLGQPYSNEFVS